MKPTAAEIDMGMSRSHSASTTSAASVSSISMSRSATRRVRPSTWTTTALSGSGTEFIFPTRSVVPSTHTGTYTRKANMLFQTSGGASANTSYATLYDAPVNLSQVAGVFRGPTVTAKSNLLEQTLTVDTNGNGSKDGSGTTLEASRLFMVADGTAGRGDGGDVAKNYSVQDKVTKDVFVYYYDDPDYGFSNKPGIGLWTALDNGDSTSSQSAVETDKDGNSMNYPDSDYYNNPGDNTAAASTPVTASNTALHLVTDIAAQTWEFHMAIRPVGGVGGVTWEEANAQAAGRMTSEKATQSQRVRWQNSTTGSPTNPLP